MKIIHESSLKTGGLFFSYNYCGPTFVSMVDTTSFWPVNETLAHFWPNDMLSGRFLTLDLSICNGWDNVGPSFTFAIGGPTLPPPDKMTLNQPPLPTSVIKKLVLPNNEALLLPATRKEHIILTMTWT